MFTVGTYPRTSFIAIFSGLFCVQHKSTTKRHVMDSKSATTEALGTFKQGVSKQGVTTFAWQLGPQHDVAAMRGADSVLASDCRAQSGRPSTGRGWRICVTVRLPVRPRGETMYRQATANTTLSVTPPPFKSAEDMIGKGSQITKALSPQPTMFAILLLRPHASPEEHNTRALTNQLMVCPRFLRRFSTPLRA